MPVDPFNSPTYSIAQWREKHFSPEIATVLEALSLHGKLHGPDGDPEGYAELLEDLSSLIQEEDEDESTLCQWKLELSPDESNE